MSCITAALIAADNEHSDRKTNHTQHTSNLSFRIDWRTKEFFSLIFQSKCLWLDGDNIHCSEHGQENTVSDPHRVLNSEYSCYLTGDTGFEDLIRQAYIVKQVHTITRDMIQKD